MVLMSGRAQGVTDVRWKSGDVPQLHGGLAVIMFRVTRPHLNLRVTTEVDFKRCTESVRLMNLLLDSVLRF